jgi:hypothetical protein
MNQYPHYAKVFLIGTILPLISYGCLTPNERIYISEQQAAIQKDADEMTLKLVGSIEKSLQCDEVDAMAALQATEQLNTARQRLTMATSVEEQEVAIEFIDSLPPVDPRHSAAVELAVLKNRQAPINRVLEQYTVLIGSRLIAEKFDAAAFEKEFKLPYKGTWTLEHTKAISALHAEVEAFVSAESNRQIAAEPEEELSAGERSPGAKAA